MDDLNQMLPGRFIITDFGNIPQDEAIEMIYKYSDIEKIPVKEYSKNKFPIYLCASPM